MNSVTLREYLLPEGDTRIIIVIGKGGVGKTTLSAAIATAISSHGYKTHIISLDPAHNLGDVLEEELSSTPKEISNNLYASELDLEDLVKKYLKNLDDSLKSMYRYLTVLNLEKYFDILASSPGIEEYATLDALMEIVKARSSWDVIVLDTPPTGLTLRVLGLPKISLIWTEKLMGLRRAILERRETIRRIREEKSSQEEYKIPTKEEEDPVMQELKKYYEDINYLYNFLTDLQKTTVVCVMNPDRLSFFETKRAKDSLLRFGLSLRLIIINKVLREGCITDELKGVLALQKEVLNKVKEEFQDLDIITIHHANDEPRGLNALKDLGIQILESD